MHWDLFVNIIAVLEGETRILKEEYASGGYNYWNFAEKKEGQLDTF